MLAPFSFFTSLNGKEERKGMMIFILWLLLCMLLWTAIKTVASWAIVSP